MRTATMLLADLALAVKLGFKQLQRPVWLDRSLAALRITVASGTVTTVTSVTGIVNFGSTSNSTTSATQISAKDAHLNHLKRIAWSQGIRTKIS